MTDQICAMHLTSESEESARIPISTVEQWLEDYVFASFLQADELSSVELESDPDELGVYFQQRYKADGRLQLLRVLAAMRWVNEHFEHYLIKRELISALYFAFATCPEELLETDFPESWVSGFVNRTEASDRAAAPNNTPEFREYATKPVAGTHELQALAANEFGHLLKDATIKEAVGKDGLSELEESRETSPFQLATIDAEIEANRAARKKVAERCRAIAQKIAERRSAEKKLPFTPGI